jgi:hypothetical protein
LTNRGIDVASSICVATAWHSQPIARQVWEWYVNATAGAGTDAGRRLVGALRIGAAAMLAGNSSTWVAVVIETKAWADPSSLEAFVRQPAVAQVEQFLSDQGGQYLGADAEAALVRFARFAAATAPAIH